MRNVITLFFLIVLLTLGTAELPITADENDKASHIMIASENKPGKTYEDKLHPLTRESLVKRDVFSIKMNSSILRDMIPREISPQIAGSFQTEIEKITDSLRKELEPLSTRLVSARRSYDSSSYFEIIRSSGLFHSRNNTFIEKFGLEVLPSQESILEEAQELALDKKDIVSLSKIADEWTKRDKSVKGDELRSTALSLQSEKAKAEKREPVTIVVYNRTARYVVNIFVNRNMKGTLKPQEKGEFPDIIAWDSLTLEAMDVNTAYGWGPRKVSVTPGETLYWKLYEE